jgi:hypothetical protein
VSANPRIYKRLNTWRVSFGGNKLVRKIVSEIYKDASVYLDRKMDLAKEIMELNLRGDFLNKTSKNDILKAHNKFKTWDKVAKHFGISKSLLYSVKKHYGIITKESNKLAIVDSCNLY